MSLTIWGRQKGLVEVRQNMAKWSDVLVARHNDLGQIQGYGAVPK